MGLPSGTLWATRNLDLTQPGKFAASEYQYECSFFSWGNIDGHNPISNSAFEYNWGGENRVEPWYEGQPYGDTPGSSLTGNIPVDEDFDAVRANLGAPWRIPTNTEFVELFDNIIYIDANGNEVDTTKSDKRVTVNDVKGLFIQSKINGERLFFPCSGYGEHQFWRVRGLGGAYWTSIWGSTRFALRLYFSSVTVYVQGQDSRFYGFALRPVKSGNMTLSPNELSKYIKSLMERVPMALDEPLVKYKL